MKSIASLMVPVEKGGSIPLFFVLFVIYISNVAAQLPPDLIVINANVRTMVSPSSTVDAFAVRSGRITAVGKSRQIRRLGGRSTTVIDARGRLVLPGFNDAHVHFIAVGNTFSSADLRSMRSSDQVRELIDRYLKFIPKGRWIVGNGWTGFVPDRDAISKISPDNPVFLYEAGAKSAFANARAFAAAGIIAQAGVERDAKGGPTGIIRGDALRAVARAVPADHTRSWPEIAETATNYAASLGITSVQDMHSDDSRAIYRELDRNGKLKTRVYDCIPLPDWRKLDELPSTVKDPMVRGGCLKSFSDGDDESGPRLLKDAIEADKAGLQLMIHAIGNRANSIVLDVFEQISKTNPRRDRRSRVEHAHNPAIEDLNRFTHSGIVASMQPHLFQGGSGGYYSSLSRQKVRIAFGSDAAIADFNPLLGIQAAISAGSESISVYEAVRAYTFGSAFAEFQEKQKGTIEVGKLADFVILSDDIFSIDRTLVGKTSVLLTAVAGEIVYEK